MTQAPTLPFPGREGSEGVRLEKNLPLKTSATRGEGALREMIGDSRFPLPQGGKGHSGRWLEFHLLPSPTAWERGRG